jgi:hypothetical protein
MGHYVFEILYFRVLCSKLNLLLISAFFWSLLGCEFPQEWPGEWNLEGERESLHITAEDFGAKGFCLKNTDDIYVIYRR